VKKEELGNMRTDHIADGIPHLLIPPITPPSWVAVYIVDREGSVTYISLLGFIEKMILSSIK
jgi:hypothetical protein